MKRVFLAKQKALYIIFKYFPLVKCVKIADTIFKSRLGWLNILREFLLFWHLERMEESSWPNKCQKVGSDGSLERGQPRKILSEEIIDFEELKCSKEHATKDRNA